ncbi:hypothetical protein ABZ829_22310 [Streptomyces xanthochromogenes]|uniref:hypothetical protein n=1 Tax=Streptomyces xanthochromogenes TaxID=67384 RepID=UPI003436A7BB
MPAPEPTICDDQVVAGPGGAMTDEVGVITGDLTVRTTRQADHRVAVAVQYTGADEWYTLTGSPITVPDGQLEDYHHRVLDAVEAGAEAEAPQ